MAFRLSLRSLPVVCLAALLAGPALGAPRAKPPAPKPPVVKPPTPPRGTNQVPEVVKQEVKLREADLLRHAYILLATANADYNGFRGKAMNSVQAAVKGLDTSVLQKGTGAQAAATLMHDSVAARAKIIDKYVKVPAGVKEPQVISDLQLRAAAQLLGQIRGPLIAHKHTGTLGHVDNAIRNISVALAIR